MVRNAVFMSEIQEMPSKEERDVVNTTTKTTKEVESEGRNTYLRLKDDQDGTVLELDLMFVRQKGESYQSLELSFTSKEEVNGQHVEVVHRKSINSKKDFELFKEFITKLSWD